MIFQNVVTIFFRLHRNLEKKNYVFQNSCPEEITPPIPLDKSSLGHFSRLSLIPENKREKKGGTESFKILFQLFSNYFSQLVFITKFGKQNYIMSCVYLGIRISQCVSLCFFVFCFFLINIADTEISL